MRPLDPGHQETVEDVLCLGVRAFQALGSYRKTLEYWINLPGVETMTAIHRGRVRGFVSYGYRADEGQSPAGEILAIAVDEAIRRQGLGAQLLQHALEQLNIHADQVDASTIRLAVAENNVPASTLFRTFGFESYRQELMYPNGQACVEMLRSIRS